MSAICVAGIGAVSPAGWGVAALRQALAKGEPLPVKAVARPGWTRPLRLRTVPAPEPRPAWFGHPRLRRASPVAQYAVGAAMEAIGETAADVRAGAVRLGIVLCVMTGCVIYSRRFYEEVLRHPGTASPLVFPETVFNSPASHLAALLGATACNYTLVGDPGTFLQGLALAADWLASERVEGCLIIGAEEADWLVADAFRLFSRSAIVAEGAGAVYLRRGPLAGAVHLDTVTRPHLFLPQRAAATDETAVRPVRPAPPVQPRNRAEAARRMREELGRGGPTDLLCDSTLGCPLLDRAESSVWQDWPGARLAPKRILGEGISAGSAWQCVAAIDALLQGRAPAALVSVVGGNQQAIGARFATPQLVASGQPSGAR